MEFETLLTPVLVTLMGGGLGALFMSNLRRIDARMDRIEANMATRGDIAQLRSDLTLVALAVGAERREVSGEQT